LEKRKYFICRERLAEAAALEKIAPKAAQQGRLLFRLDPLRNDGKT
jgi:hypothetical protein